MTRNVFIWPPWRSKVYNKLRLTECKRFKKMRAGLEGNNISGQTIPDFTNAFRKGVESDLDI